MFLHLLLCSAAPLNSYKVERTLLATAVTVGTHVSLACVSSPYSQWWTPVITIPDCCNKKVMICCLDRVSPCILADLELKSTHLHLLLLPEHWD